MIGNFTKAHWHYKSHNPHDCLTKRWKGEPQPQPQVVAATAPPQPTTAEAIKAWVASMPTVFAEQQRQAPLEAAQQLALAQQYATPLAQVYKSGQEVLYPGTSQLQETMANQALTGMTATTMPDWMRQQYISDLNAQLGTNAGSPIGAEYVSRNMQNQLFNQQKYYRDLGLSLSGRQPLTQPVQPQTPNYTSTFTPQSAMNFAQQGYGTYAAASRPLGFIPPQQRSGGFFGLFG